MTSRKIVLSDCGECKSCDHQGGFGYTAYVPICRLANKELPHDIERTSSGRRQASRHEGIPDWCPLPVNEEPKVTPQEIVTKALDKCKNVAIESGAHESYKAVGEAFESLRAVLSQPEQIQCEYGRTHKRTAYGRASNEPVHYPFEHVADYVVFVDATGFNEGDTLEITTPQFEREDGLKVAAPVDFSDWENLHIKDDNTLRAFGFRVWENDEKGKHWLFPKEWYSIIPDGFPIIDISGIKEEFKSGVTDDDCRFGCLAYGFITPSEDKK